MTDTPIDKPTTAQARDLADSAAKSPKDARALAESLAVEALEYLAQRLRDTTAKDSARQAAARDILYVHSRMPDATKSPDTRTPEEKEAYLDELMTTPEVQGWLEAKGWEKKKPKATKTAKGKPKP